MVTTRRMSAGGALRGGDAAEPTHASADDGSWTRQVRAWAWAYLCCGKPNMRRV